MLITSISHSQEVIASSGDYFEAGNIKISWTLGEPVTETFTQAAIILTQGFQQSKIDPISIYELPELNFEIDLFPNPVRNEINLYTEQPAGLSLKLFDFKGVLLREQQVVTEKTTVDVNDLASGGYFLLVSGKGKMLKSFLVIKQ
jgi:hypothetical protein